MSEIKSGKAKEYAMRNMLVCPDCKDRSCRLCYLSVQKSYSDGLVESEERHTTLLADADGWAYHLNYTKNDLMNALCIFFHVAQSIGIKSGVINTTDLAEAAGVKLREAVITLTGIDPSEVQYEEPNL